MRDVSKDRRCGRWRNLAGIAGAIAALAVAAALPGAGGTSRASAQSAQPRTPSTPYVDPYTPKPRLLVLTDIANEPDDQMSFVRLLVYANHFDIEGLVATTSTWLKKGPRPDVLHTVLDAYAQVQPRLFSHQPGFPTASSLRALVSAGQPGYGMAAVGPGKSTPGSEAVVRAVEREDPRPLWVSVWGGANTLAQALLDLRSRRGAEDVERLVARLRVYAISDQDDAGPWIRGEFPALSYVAMPSPPDGQEYAYATWTGISGDRFYLNAPGADFGTWTDEWVDANIRRQGPLGAHYPHPCCIHEGDTPAFLGLIDNGLASAMSPAFGGWGGRYVWRQPSGEPRAFWTQGGDSYPGSDTSRDTVVVNGTSYTSDQATIWRWRRAFQHDFAARMQWTVSEPRAANHTPDVVVNGQGGKAPVMLDARVGEAVGLDAAGTRDPDGHALTYRWFFYPEAGMGIPGQRVFAGPRFLDAAGAPTANPASAVAHGFPRVAPRVVVEQAESAVATVIPKVPGIAHVILEVEDAGSPALTSYRRVVVRIAPAR